MLFIPESKIMSVLIIYIVSKNILSEIPVGYIGGSKHGSKSFDRLLVIVIPYLLWT